MPEVIGDLVDLPRGAHCASFHATPEEASQNAVDLLAGAPEGQASMYWVSEPGRVHVYDRQLSEEAPSQVGCVAVLSHEQVTWVEGKLRPVPEVLEFVRSHPEGVTAAGDTLSEYWAPRNIPDHLEYERWFETQPRDSSRFLCPYDLRKIPPELAQLVMNELGAHHSHVTLSRSEEPAVRLLQLFLFTTVDQVPPNLSESLDWAERTGLVSIAISSGEIQLTPDGAAAIRLWSEGVAFDWSSAPDPGRKFSTP
ncbi:MAG TPA: hypothetical protein VGV89_08410 [Thermoplasmata archaeon]|nr:hypothetical protein [Thermoplasmata archaeon]